MGLVNAQVFIGTRCRLCRHRDAKFVNGWIQYFKGESLVVSTEDAMGTEPGDEFFMEAYGPKVKGSANTLATTVSAAGSNGKVQVSLRLVEPVKIAQHNEPTRILVEHMTAEVTYNGAKFMAKIRDVSLGGIGLLCDHEIAKGSQLDLGMNTQMGVISATGIVRHVRKQDEGFRIGVELQVLSRLDGSRWRKLMGEAA